jgi:hypothetical protein
MDDSGRFYKPLQDGARGDKEVNFYNKFWSDPNVPPSVQKFFPKFYGTIEIETPNADGEVNILNRDNRYTSFKRNYCFQYCIQENVFGLLFWFKCSIVFTVSTF